MTLALDGDADDVQLSKGTQGDTIEILPVGAATTLSVDAAGRRAAA